jgi:hypothetical protein
MNRVACKLTVFYYSQFPRMDPAENGNAKDTAGYPSFKRVEEEPPQETALHDEDCGLKKVRRHLKV